jgi:hypothetical protein
MESRSGGMTIDYVCGDVTQLCDYFGNDESSQDNGAIFDMVILDKGLTDAILCSEGWDGPLERMLQQATTILTPNTGQYLLISYRLVELLAWSGSMILI